MAAKGKGYKAQAKAEAERAEKAIVAGRALQMQHQMEKHLFQTAPAI